jgi:hypothetical protein
MVVAENATKDINMYRFEDVSPLGGLEKWV